MPIRADKIVAVGDDAAIEKFRHPGTKVIDAAGQLVLPGFVDCHIHFLDGSISLGRVNLEGAKDVPDIQQRLRDYAAKHPGTDWLLGRGWDYAMFGAATFPDKKYLDELFPDRPVFLEGYDGHTYWANSKALAMAGVTRTLPILQTASSFAIPLHSEPTGALKEAAHGLVGKFVPSSTRAEKLAALRDGIKWANQNGLTRVHSAGGDFPRTGSLRRIAPPRRFDPAFLHRLFHGPARNAPAGLEAIENARARNITTPGSTPTP